MKNRFFTNGSLSQFPGIIYQPNLATFLGKFILILTLLTSVCTFAIAQTESDYEVEDVSDEYKKVCWPIKNTSKTQATTDKMTTDTAGFPTVKSGGLASYRQMYTAVEVPNIFPAPDTAEIFDLLGNPLIINGDTLRFFPSTLAASLAQANMTPPLTPGYHWVGYISSPFRPDNVAVYYYNIFHRWYGGMPCNYESYGGRQWNSDNSGLAHPSDTFFQPHPVSAFIQQPISCYGSNNGIIKVNTNPLNYYTFSLNGGPATLTNSFSALTAGTYTITITDSFANSCDTVITLTQPASLGSTTNVSNCGSYTWPLSGLTYNTPGTYVFTTSSTATGCPIHDTLNLTLTTTTNNSTTVTAYNFYTWPVTGQTFTQSGSYFNSAVSPNGCQVFSILNLNLIFTPYNMDLVVDQEISCFGSSDGSIQATGTPPATNYIYKLNGNLQVNNTGFFSNLSPGTYTVCMSAGATGPQVCKTITLVAPPPIAISIVTDSLVSCLGNDGKLSATINGGVTVVQPYLTYWINSANIILNPFPNHYATSLSGLSPGMYTLTVEDDHGCTGSQATILNAAPPLTVSATFAPLKCNGGTTAIQPVSSGGIPPVTFSMFGTPLAPAYPAGTYTITATDSKGCTATTEITITQPPVLFTSMSATACNNYYWSMNATTYTATGTYVSVLTTLNGCTVLNMLDLTINNNSTSTTNITACNSYMWSVTGNVYTASGTYTTTTLNTTGCILTATLNLTILSSSSGTTNASACDSYTWSVPGNTMTYTNSGTYTATYLNAAGCVHTQTLNLFIGHNTHSFTSATACNAYNWSAANASNPYTVSGLYTATSINTSGCIRRDTLSLTINVSTSSVTNATACTSYTWNKPGASNPYTASGIYTATSVNTGGCLQRDTLYLTINQNTTSAQSATACNSYTWNKPGAANPYTASGIYTLTSLNAAGCLHRDSLYLTIKQSSASTSNVTAANGYTWSANGITYTVSGSYTATMLNAAGCDSVLTLNLQINYIPSSLTLRCFFEGFMESGNSMKPVLFNQGRPSTPTACDTIIVALHKASFPFNTLYSSKVVLQRNGFVTCSFPALYDNFYLVVNHRNVIQTWSSVPVFVGASPVTYNFTTAANKAYGANQTPVAPGTWAFFSGDVDINENIDLLDMIMIEYDIENFNFGYMPTDINGDGSVDLLDPPLVEYNLLNYIFSEHP